MRIPSATKSTFVFSRSESMLKIFLDIAYPFWDVVILAIALILGISFKFFGGKYKLPIQIILIGFLFMYIADFLFSYLTTLNMYYNGSIFELMFTIAFFFLTLGVLGFYFPSRKKNKYL